MKAAPDKSHFFLTRVNFLGLIIEGNTITQLKSPIDVILKLHQIKRNLKISGNVMFFKQTCL